MDYGKQAVVYLAPSAMEDQNGRGCLRLLDENFWDTASTDDWHFSRRIRGRIEVWAEDDRPVPILEFGDPKNPRQSQVQEPEV